MKNFSLLPEFLLRTPTLPFSALWTGLNNQDTPEQMVQTLRKVYTDKKVQEALFLGSPNLHQRCLEWLDDKITDNKERKKIEQSLFRYYFRMSTRCTPFGLFAACSMGKWGKDTEITLPSLPAMSRNTRLDMHYLCALSQHLEADVYIRPFLTYFPNSSLYQFGDKLRFVEYYYKDNVRRHHISGVESSPYLAQILSLAEGGTTLQELIEAISDEKISADEAEAFIHEVINSQLLVSELEPAITGEDLLKQLLAVLNRIKEQQEEGYPTLLKIIDALTTVRELLVNLDQNPTENRFSTYQQIANELDQLGVSYDIKKLFQVDMGRKPEQLQFKNRLAGNIRKGLDIINRLTPRKQSISNNLQAFRDAFFERYETKEMPLLHVLDNESGIGYMQNTGPGDSHPMIDDVYALPMSGGAQSFEMEKQEIFLMKKLMLAIEKGETEITIKDDEVREFPSPWGDIPDTLSVMGSIVGTTASDNSSEKIFIKSAGNSSAANLLGRFTHLAEDIESFTKKITKHEQELYPNLIFAEIVHLPEARTGNILMRTQLRPYEIPFLAKSSVGHDHQIALQDLWLSVKNDRLVLRSKKLNKEIIPRLSTAHNYALSALPVYQFLCDLQFQQLPAGNFEDKVKWVAGDIVNLSHRHIMRGLGFNWGPLSGHFKFLPRVSYQNIILSRASWNLKKEDYKHLLKLQPTQRVEAIREWRKSLNMPQRIAIADYDNELFIDLEHPVCVDGFVETLKKRPSIQLIEFLFDPERAAVKDPNAESYTNEFVMAFARKKGKQIIPYAKMAFSPPTIQRSFPLGSEWLYYKCYTGARSADGLLANAVLPLVEQLKEAQLIDHWFFIRYADPKLHFRLRFHLKDPIQIGQVINIATDYLSQSFNNKKIWKIQADTYEREVERYGLHTMELSEEIFFRDSEAILTFLNLSQEYEDPELLRWYFAMININALLDSFQLDLKAKSRLLKSLKVGFAKEFNANNKQGNKQMNEKYRLHRKATEDIVLGQFWEFPEELSALIVEKSALIQPVSHQILSLREQGYMQLSLESFLSSHIHMIMNRLFRSQQRKYEWVIYDMLSRAYHSSLARARVSS